MTIWGHLVDQPSCDPSRDSWTKSLPRCIHCCGAHSEARLAQSAERKALNLVVVGSSPTVGVSLGQPVAACPTDAPISQAAPFKHHLVASVSAASGLTGASSCRLRLVCRCWALAPVSGGLSTSGVWHIGSTPGLQNADEADVWEPTQLNRQGVRPSAVWSRVQVPRGTLTSVDHMAASRRSAQLWP